MDKEICQNELNEISSDLLEFLKEAVTSFHAVAAIENRLLAEGFTELKEENAWKKILANGGKYFVKKNNSSIIAFQIPKTGFAPFRIVASHSDSPCFKIKENAEISAAGKYVKLNTEVYGGAIYYSWFDRPLSIAGRLLVETEEGIEEKLIDFKKEMVVLPSLAIHLNREINKGYKFNEQKDLQPLFTLEEHKGSLMKLAAHLADTTEEAILGHDLFIYNPARAAIWGVEGEFLSGPRLDDLACVYASFKSFLGVSDMELQNISVCAVFDNEEEGSLTKQGADSTFLWDVLKRISMAFVEDEEEFFCNIAASFMVSADNAHAVHPNHVEKHDEGNRCFLNEGPVIKFSAAQKYTTDAVSSARFKKLCKKAKVPYQVFANRSDMGGGSTLGRLLAGHVSIDMVDIGIPQLAMHSSYETMGTKDYAFMIKVLNEFYMEK